MVTDLSQWDDTLFTLHNKSALLHLYHLWFTGSRETRVLMTEEVQKAALWCGLSSDELGDDIIPDIDFVHDLSHNFILTVNADLVVEVQDRHNIRHDQTDLPLEILEARNQHQELLDAAKTVQTILFERAMIDERRWSAAAFQRHFLHHLVKCHIAQQLIWGIYEGDQLLRTFYIMNDLSLSDVNDHSLTLPPKAQIGIPHPLYLAEHERAQWLHLLHDYKIIQPFPQIGRKVYRLTEQELARKNLDQWEEVATPYKQFEELYHNRLSWEQQGWRFSNTYDKDHVLDESLCQREFIQQNALFTVWIHAVYDNYGEFCARISELKLLSGGEMLPLVQVNPLIVSETLHFLHAMFQPEEDDCAAH